MLYSNIFLEPSEDGITTLTINRPDKLNALSVATMSELDDALRCVEHDSEHRALILTGAGEKAFVAGADINELVEATPLRVEGPLPAGSSHHAASGDDAQSLDRRHQRLCARRGPGTGDVLHACASRPRPPNSACRR